MMTAGGSTSAFAPIVFLTANDKQNSNNNHGNNDRPKDVMTINKEGGQ
jgi:hypothetical protein